MHYRVAGNINPDDFPALNNDCILFYHPSCKPLAEKIAGCALDIHLGQIDWGCDGLGIMHHIMQTSHKSHYVIRILPCDLHRILKR
jgi:hypothetical protein